MIQNDQIRDGHFEGKTAVITGAAQGIGLAIAQHLHGLGTHLLLIDCKAEQLRDAARELQRTNSVPVRPCTVDLADPSAIQSLGRQLADEQQQIDILVNNAAIEADIAFDQVSVEVFNQVIAVNLRAPMLMAQVLAPLFPQHGGSIVNISSIHADHAFPNALPYACSKAGLVALTRNLALELAPRRIRVNAICPGYIDTPMWDEWLRSSSDPEGLARHTQDLHPLGRRGVPQDVAMAVAYLAGEQSAWVTGTTLVVDGGLTIRAHP